MAQPDEASADDLPVTSEESETEQEQVQSAAEQEKPIVYMTRDISPSGLQAVYDALQASPTGRSP